MAYTLAEAAKAVQRNKTSLLRAIKAGKISAARDATTGGWLIEPAELHRVYPEILNAAKNAATDIENAALRSGEAEIEIRELRARLGDTHDQITDLRRRLDEERAERRQTADRLAVAQERIAALLTDQRPATPAPAKRRWWQWRS
jgi:chromosome segregation ATPase